MPKLPSLGNAMFFSEELAPYVRLVNDEHSNVFDFARRLNEVAHLALFSAKLVRTDLQQVLLISLLQRAMKAYQSSILLWERGLPQDGQVVLRTLLEVTFKTVAIARHPEVATNYVQEDEALRKKFINKYKRLSAETQDPKVIHDLEALLHGCKEAIRENGIRELTTHWFAEKAQLLDFYNSAYTVLSSEVHVSVRTLERALNIDSSGKITSLQYGFSDEGLDQHVLAAAEALLLTLSAAFTKGDVPESSVKALEQMHEELRIHHRSASE